MPAALIALGSNLGNKQHNVQQAFQLLHTHENINVVAQSGLHTSQPAGGPGGQQEFVNAAVAVNTTLDPHALLREMWQIEDALGRERVQHWGPRTLDLDLLLFDQQVIDTADLQVPHPRMAHRRFVLEPATEAAPQMKHPRLRLTVQQMLDHLNNSPPYFALTGATGCGKSTLMADVAEVAGLRRIDEPVDDASLTDYYGDPENAAWHVEMQILRLRTRLLDAASQMPQFASGGAISDFWFDQALAFARIALPDKAFEQYQTAWIEASQKVIQPRLVVVLQTTPGETRRRIHHRGRHYELQLSEADLATLQNGIEQIAHHTQTPLLYLNGANRDAARAELLATIEAMR